MNSGLEDREPWVPIAHRGQLTIAVLSRARAEQEGISMHPTAALVVMMHPDGGHSIPVSFVSIESVRAYMKEMEPRHVDVLCAQFEDPEPLIAALRDVGVTLH